MSLFNVELKSHWLKSQLAKPHSVRFKLFYISKFLSNLLKEIQKDKYISYFLEFEPELVNLILKNESTNPKWKFDFFSPAEINEIQYVVNSVSSIKQFENDIEKLNKCNIKLKDAKDRINSILLDSQLHANNHKSSVKDSINIVLIETNGDEDGKIGTIEKIHLRASKRSKEFKDDKIEFDDLHEDDYITSNINGIVTQTKLETIKEGLSISNYHLSYFLEGIDCTYTGPSFGAALGVLTYNSLLITELHKKYYSFYDDVVITGAVDENGNLIKLDYETLKTKLNTVFFSRFTKFVIPEDNILEAKDELYRLLAEYPKRNLKLIPLRKFKDAFSNLEIVEVKKLKLREKLKTNYKRYHAFANMVLSFVVIIILAVLTINVVVPVLDHNPVYASLNVNRYIAYNKYSRAVWESDLLSNIDIGYANSPVYGTQRILVSDLDNDGTNEILLLLASDKDKTLKRKIFCYDSDGTTKWETVIPPKDSLYGKDECYDDLIINGITVINNSTNKQKEIIAGYKICSLFPYYLSRINYSGKIISDFYHPGHLIYGKIEDLDQDGFGEYITGGENNDLDHCPVLLILDPNYVSGNAPGKRFPRNFDKGLMKYFILFPKSPFNKFTSNRNAYVHAIEIAKDYITVAVQEVLDPYNTTETSSKNIFFTLYVFNKKMNVISVSTSTEFDVVYKTLLEKKKIQPIDKWKAMEDSLKSLVRWWDGDKFVNYPAMNKYYLQAKAERKAVNK